MRRALYFVRPYEVEVRTETLPQLEAQQLLVKTVASAISAGTELLFYRGQVPSHMTVDASIAGMADPVQYPLAYGYCSAGEVVAIGSSVDRHWQGRRVFAFQPHASHFISDAASLQPIPDELSYEQATLLPNMETAVNFVMDARPLVGERVLVFGLGIVGLLTVHLLHRFPLAQIVAVDAYTKRQTVAHRWGVDHVYEPASLADLHDFDPDLILELSSNPAALASATDLVGFGTRIVVGSWYGDKVAHLPLGGAFHRNRVQIISSQVSTVDGQFANRWDKARRLELAWEHLKSLPIDDLITHRLPITSASEAYEMLDKRPDQALQVIFTYDS
jgi:2-desacetyl-2-hydroxyethyl bacteriochlorophyllide A dehydrogenase